ncbi:hypothetical protein THAOC_00421, partial [Thalassiosira oceanica]
IPALAGRECNASAVASCNLRTLSPQWRGAVSSLVGARETKNLQLGFPHRFSTHKPKLENAFATAPARPPGGAACGTVDTVHHKLRLSPSMSSNAVLGAVSRQRAAGGSPAARTGGTTCTVAGPGHPAFLATKFGNLLPKATRFSEAERMRKEVLRHVEPFGINRIILGKGSHKNKNEKTIGTFPHHRWNWVCGVCKPADRNKPADESGCCGFKVNALVVDNDDGYGPHAVITKFSFSALSKHMLVRAEARAAASGDRTVRHEDQLTSAQTNLLNVLGKNRSVAQEARDLFGDLFPDVKLDTNLMNRVMRKGLHDACGKDDDESMTLFVTKLVEWKKDGGFFKIEICPVTGKLLSVACQMKLETALAERYGTQVYFCDTTHNTTKYGLKAGPLGSIDCFGHTPPIGYILVPEESGQVVHDRLTDLKLNNPGAIAGTTKLDSDDQRHSKETPIGAYHVLDFSTQWPQGSSI